MIDKTDQPATPEELEHRFQEVRAQQMRAAFLFHGYTVSDDEDVDDADAANWDD